MTFQSWSLSLSKLLKLLLIKKCNTDRRTMKVIAQIEGSRMFDPSMFKHTCFKCFCFKKQKWGYIWPDYVWQQKNQWRVTTVKLRIGMLTSLIFIMSNSQKTLTIYDHFKIKEKLNRIHKINARFELCLTSKIWYRN